MKKETYINIPQPCHQNWNAMTPQDKGRFCAACAKTVIDFSQMSDTQVLDYLSGANGRICGRFAQDQVERPLIPMKKEKKRIWWLAAVMPLSLLLSKANGQNKIVKVKSQTAYETMGLVAVEKYKANDTTHSVNNKTITGTIVDENKHPLTGVTINLKGTNISTATDNSGKFSLSFSNPDPSIKIIISYIGYQEKELSYIFSDATEMKIDTQSLVLVPAMTGEMVVVGYIRPRRQVKKIDTVKTTVRKIFHINPFKVYPNPVHSGAEVYIEINNEGHYSIQLLDINSRLTAHTLFNAEKGITTASLIIPSSVAAGMYFIRLINDDTKQQFTEKIVVE